LSSASGTGSGSASSGSVYPSNATCGGQGASGCGNNPPQTSNKPVRYFSGAVILPQTDIDVPQGGLFSQVRYYNNQGYRGPANYNGPNGYNWWVGAMPYVVKVNGSVAVISDPNNPYWFSQSGTTYTLMYAMQNVKLTEDTVAKTLTLMVNNGGTIEITVFNSLSSTTAPGQFVSYTDSRGIMTKVAATSGTLITELQRMYISGGTPVVESLLYIYYTTTTAVNKIETVLYRRWTAATDWTNISQVSYAYYDDMAMFGNVNDLMSATQQIPNGTGWDNIGVDFYRYYTSGAPYVRGLKMHFGPSAYQQLINASINPATAADSIVMPYADQYYEYNTAAQATKEIAAVCASCPGGGTTSDEFAYSINPAYPPYPSITDPNTWLYKTVQTLPVESGGTAPQIVVYNNYRRYRCLPAWRI
jgi:hypothetical protein